MEKKCVNCGRETGEGREKVNGFKGMFCSRCAVPVRRFVYNLKYLNKKRALPSAYSKYRSMAESDGIGPDVLSQLDDWYAQLLKSDEGSCKPIDNVYHSKHNP